MRLERPEFPPKKEAPKITEAEQRRLYEDDRMFAIIVTHWTWTPACVLLVLGYVAYSVFDFIGGIFY